MTNFLNWRDEHRPRIQEQYGVRLGFMGAFTKATTLAAAEVPEVNASINMDKQQITYRDFANVSIAVSTDRGLVTPVVKNCEKQSVVDLEKSVAALAKKVDSQHLDILGRH